MNLGVGTIQPIMIRAVITSSHVWSSQLRGEEPGLLYFEFNTFPPPVPWEAHFVLGFSWPARVVVGLSRSEQTVLWSIFISMLWISLWNKINMVLKYTGISQRWNFPVFVLPHLPFLFCNCFLSLDLYLVIVGFGCLLREMRLWEKRSLETKIKPRKPETGRMAFSVCVATLANS